MTWSVEFQTAAKTYRLALLGGITIIKSVENLSDTASILLPESIMNRPVNITETLSRGDKVSIQLGYDDNLRTEFEGYILKISDKDGALTIDCEDAMFLLRKKVADNTLLNPNNKQILQYLAAQTAVLSGIDCDFDIGWESYVIKDNSAYDVLKRLKEETNANIYLKNNILHLHARYSETGKEVVYDFGRNINSAQLSWKNAQDKPMKVKIEYQGLDGKIRKAESGEDGGDIKTIKVGTMNAASLQEVADSWLAQYVYTGYEGSFSGWLLPNTEPTDTVKLQDPDKEYKDGSYYVLGITTSFDQNGAKREVKLGLKLN